MASKSYGWDVRNIAKIGQKTVIFQFFFSKTVHTIRTKASQKEKDLSRLLYRICGSGLKLDFSAEVKFFKFKNSFEC